ncbi:MAG: hypothetical protein RI965_1145 [Bacteroidota bacterium]|jgi:peptidoglycan/xylan/chitin deacetylase (PgdA/CDA1 family)
MQKVILIFILCFFNASIFAQSKIVDKNAITDQGAIIQADPTHKKIAFVFTGDEYFEGLESIISTLAHANIKANFFFTGRLYRNQAVKDEIMRLKSDGHYLGPHSDMHLLYNDWSDRNKLLVTKDSLINDLKANYRSMQAMGIEEKELYFIPPYEWWNDSVATWCKELNVQLINFTPGTGTNADYTFPEMGTSYRSTESLLKHIYEIEKKKGLNGAMILIHIGTDPRRIDKFYNVLPLLIDYLKSKEYSFLRIDQLLK